MAKFIILALPRCRTKWTSEFLSFEGRYAVGHDLAVDCSSVQDFEDALDSVDGTVETGAVLGWRLLRTHYPALRIATISRPLWQIERSLMAQGVWWADRDQLALRAEMLQALALQPGVQNFTFDGLNSESECARLWEYCLGRDFDFEWWADMRGKNLQIDMAARVARLSANAPGLASLTAEIISETHLIGDSAWRLN